VRLKADE